MKILLKLSFLTYFFAFMTAGELFARRVPAVAKRPALPIYWADVVIDTVGAAGDAFIKTVSSHPVIFVMILIFIPFLFLAHSLYENSLSGAKNNNSSIFLSEQEAVKKSLSVPLSRFIYIATIVLLILSSVFFFRDCGKNLPQELQKKKIERDKIDYKAKTVEDAYKNAR